MFLLIVPSLCWASEAPFSLRDATVEPAFSASKVEWRTWGLKMTSPTMNTARLRTTTAEETPCLCRTDTEKGDPAMSARPAGPPAEYPLCPWTERCTVRWTAMVWSLWSEVPLLSRLLWGSYCQRWGLWTVEGTEGGPTPVRTVGSMSTDSNFPASVFPRPRVFWYYQAMNLSRQNLLHISTN